MSFRLPYKKGLPFILEMNHPKTNHLFLGDMRCVSCFSTFMHSFQENWSWYIFVRTWFPTFLRSYRDTPKGTYPRDSSRYQLMKGILFFNLFSAFYGNVKKIPPPQFNSLPLKSSLKAPKGEKKSSKASMATPGAFAVKQGVCEHGPVKLLILLGERSFAQGISYDTMNQPIMEHWQRQ